MIRYATIELNSGYVWWVGDAANAREACVKSDQAGEPGMVRDFNFKSGNDTGGGYAVYEVDDDFDVENGQSQREIEATEEFPCAGMFIGRKPDNYA